MVLTTLRVCLQQKASNSISVSRIGSSFGLGLMALSFALLMGCGGNSVDSASIANPGNGNGLHPTISLTPTSFSFAVTQGDANPLHTVIISNSGNGNLSWSMSASASWLTLSPSTGTASGNASDTVTATANLSGLAAGTYSATITVFGVGATNNGQDIPVTLTIAAPVSSTSTTTTSTSTTTTSTSPTTTASAALSWAAETDLTVTGYYVHYGTQSPNSVGSCAYAYSVYYSLTSLASAASPTATVSSLTTGTTYYFAVSAYNGSESLCSNEVAKAT